jgi:hypothetical protein
MPFLREESRLDMRLKKVGIYAENVKQKKPRKAHQTSDRSIEDN